MTADEVRKLLQMEPLAKEGGYFKKGYRSDEVLPAGALPGREGPHVVGGSILYLLEAGTYSRLHRLPTDEVYHFYLGDPVLLTVLRPDGTGETIRLGQDIAHGERVQAVVPRGTFQGSRVADGGSWALVGTTMAPDYEDCDYEDGDREALLRSHPAFAHEIAILGGGPKY